MSRAGREPGFKKQNQDNCFAFEKYICEGQALFGTFDGHGPEGGLPAFVGGFEKENRFLHQTNHIRLEWARFENMIGCSFQISL